MSGQYAVDKLWNKTATHLDFVLQINRFNASNNHNIDIVWKIYI